MHIFVYKVVLCGVCTVVCGTIAEFSSCIVMQMATELYSVSVASFIEHAVMQ
jgi:hypothetical protein